MTPVAASAGLTREKPQSMRFRPRQRLRHAREFDALRDRGRRIDAGPFVVWWRWREDGRGEPEAGAAGQTDVRFGVTASRRIGGAVVRNRLKRVFRELFRELQVELPGGADLWVQLKADCRRMRVEELRRRLLESARRFAAIRPPEKRDGASGGGRAPEAREGGRGERE